jgi:uncharacterized membrane protein YkvA (DUF1232 family)
MARTNRTGRTGALLALGRALRGSLRPGEPGLLDRVKALPGFVGDTLRGDYPGSSRRRLGLLALALLYVVSPVDLIPEALFPVVGLADDAVVVAWLAGQLLGETDSYLRWQRAGGRRSRVVPGQVVDG